VKTYLPTRNDKRGLTLVEIILGVTIIAVLTFAAFVSFQHVFNKTREHVELAALKSVAREAQALLAMSGADQWDTQAGLDAVLGALGDWPPTQASSIVGVVADSSELIITEGDLWPSAGELTFTRAPNTLLLVVSLDAGACVVAAPPQSGVVQGGCLSELETVGEQLPSQAVTADLVSGIGNTASTPTEPTTTTTEPEPDPGFWAQIATGWSHTCGLANNGDTYCWGQNTTYQLGTGNTANKTAPTKLFGDHSFVSLDAGHNHTCGLTSVGEAYCWGANGVGQLGAGNNTTQTTPVKVVGNHRFVAIAVGSNHTCAITTAGEAYCWGNNGMGQLGIGFAGGFYSNPQVVVGNHVFTAITTNNQHTCALTTEGDAYCWGNNNYGQLGIGNSSQYANPVKVLGNHIFDYVAAGVEHTCALTTESDAYCWGYGTDGRLGNGGTAHHTSPVKVVGGHRFKDLFAGFSHSCGLTTDNQMLCWSGSYTAWLDVGYGPFQYIVDGNNFGQQGNGQIGTPTNLFGVPTPVVGEHSFKNGSTKVYHTCGVTTEGDAYCWGENSQGQLGLGHLNNQTIPTLVPEP